MYIIKMFVRQQATMLPSMYHSAVFARWRLYVPHLMDGLLGPCESARMWHLDQLAIFAGQMVVTSTHTDHAAYNIFSSRPQLCILCMQCGIQAAEYACIEWWNVKPVCYVLQNTSGCWFLTWYWSCCQNLLSTGSSMRLSPSSMRFHQRLLTSLLSSVCCITVSCFTVVIFTLH